MRQPKKVTKRVAVDIETRPTNASKYWDPEFLHRDRGEALDTISSLAVKGCMNDMCDFTVCNGTVEQGFITAECTQERLDDGSWTFCRLADSTDETIKRIVEILDGYVD